MAGGKRGPAPVPTNIKKFRGNPGKQALNNNEPKPRLGAECPTWLSLYAKQEWARIYPDLKHLDLVTVADQQILAAYCESYARWRQAEQIIQEQKKLERKAVRLVEEDYLNGKATALELATAKINERFKGLTFITDKGNVIQHPAVGIANQAKKDMLKFAQELGCTPAARTRIQVTQRNPQGDLFEGLDGMGKTG